MKVIQESFGDWDDEVTAVEVPRPKSGTYAKVTLADIEDRLDEVKKEMQRVNDPYHDVCRVYSYLIRYRDAIRGGRPNVPRITKAR